MIALAIAALYFVIGAVAFCAIVALVIYGINTFIYSIPDIVVKGIWFIVLCLVLIALLTMLAGGGGGFSIPRFH